MARRLLRASVGEAERVLGAPAPPIAHFAEEQSAELRDRIFDEFNSLAIVLRAPAASFVQDGPPALLPAEDDALPQAARVGCPFGPLCL